MVRKPLVLPNKTVYVLLRNLAYALMLGFLLYHLFPFPPIVWRFGLVGLSVIGLIIHIKKFHFTSIEKSMLAFVLLNVIYFLFSLLWQSPELTYFGNMLCSTLPMFLFYVLSMHGVITRQSLTVFLILSCICGYFYFRHAEDLIILATLNREIGGLTVNASAIFLVIIPLLFFIRNKWIVVLASIMIIFFIIYGAKRGNIISMAIPFYLLFRQNLKYNKTLINEAILFLVTVGLCYFAYDTMINSDYVMNRIEKALEGDTSGRGEIFYTASQSWYNAEHLYNLIFGYGTDGTVNLIGIRAHNDWLEVLVDYGLIGFFSYLIFFVNLLKVSWRIRHNNQLFYALIAVFFIWFSKSLYSMGFANSLFSYLSMIIGTILGLECRYNHKRVL